MVRGSSVLLPLLFLAGAAVLSVEGRCECRQKEKCECSVYVDVNPGKDPQDRVYGTLHASLTYVRLDKHSTDGNIDVVVRMNGKQASKTISTTNNDNRPVCISILYEFHMRPSVDACVYLSKVKKTKESNYQLKGQVNHFVRVLERKLVKDTKLDDFLMHLKGVNE